jgi:hypothetical protein
MKLARTVLSIVGPVVVLLTIRGFSEDADLFKKFVEKPPVIENLVYSQEMPGVVTNYYRLKFQRPAMFFGRSSSPIPASDAAESSKDYSEWIGRFGSQYLNKSYNMLFSWTNEADDIDLTNTVKFHYVDAMENQISKILNMGCQLAPIGSIHWNGDTFVVKNPEQHIRVEGALKRGQNGKAASLIVVPHPLNGGAPDFVSSEYNYTYDYEKPLSLSYLPNVIIETFKSAKGPPISLKYTILAIEVATNRIASSAFLLNPRIESNLIYIAISNGKRVFANGSVQPDIGLAARKRSSLSRYYFVLAALLFFLPPAIYAFSHLKSVNKNKGKES